MAQMMAQMTASCASAGKLSSCRTSRTASLRPMKHATPMRKSRIAVRAEAETPAGIEVTGPNLKALKDVQEIMDILPHR
jgi:hypothetical protein